MSPPGSRNPGPSVSLREHPAVDSALRRIRQPAYVGKNRCIPCTLLNSILAAGLSLLVAAVYPLGGIGIFVFALGLIYLRGYLVPYSPVLTARLFPTSVLSVFDHGPGQDRLSTPTVPRPTADPERVLRAADAIESCATQKDLCLRTRFKRDLYTTITRLRGQERNRVDLLEAIGLSPGAVDIVEYADAFAAFQGDRRVGQWESNAALLADGAGARVLSERFEPWESLTLVDRGAVLGALRLFLTECPDCGGRVTFGTDTVESCCRDIEVVAVTCDSCGSRLFEHSLAGLDL